MKYYLCVVLIFATTTVSFAADKTTAAEASVYVRLVKVDHSPSEIGGVIATFEPIRLNSGFGGGAGFGGGGFGGSGGSRAREAETVIGKPFTVAFYFHAMNAHKTSLVNVIQSCADWHAPNHAALKLHLVLLIPADAAKDISHEDLDFSQWVIQAVDVVH